MTYRDFENIQRSNEEFDGLVVLLSLWAYDNHASYENTTAGIYGIAATAAEATEEIVVYLTGEFFADAITLPEGVTADTLAKAFRNIGIFLK